MSNNLNTAISAVQSAMSIFEDRERRVAQALQGVWKRRSDHVATVVIAAGSSGLRARKIRRW
jgi:hypothetical protein